MAGRRARGSRGGREGSRRGRKGRRRAWRGRRIGEWRDIRRCRSLWIRLERGEGRGEAAGKGEKSGYGGIASAVEGEVSEEVQRGELRYEIHRVVR